MLREVKSKCAIEGRTMRGVTLLFFQNWLDGGTAAMQILAEAPSSSTMSPSSTKDGDDAKDQTLPPWFGIAAKHIRHDVPHDMKSIRASIAKGRADEWSERERRIREGAN